MAAAKHTLSGSKSSCAKPYMPSLPISASLTHLTHHPVLHVKLGWRVLAVSAHDGASVQHVYSSTRHSSTNLILIYRLILHHLVCSYLTA